jgi:chromosomal replication initiator protein
MIGVKNEKPVTITYIKRKVCDYFNVSTIDLCSKGRTRELTYARQIAMYLARELTNVSLPKIGENFGDRDHSTVMHACDKVKTLLISDPETKSIINLLISNIKNDE